MHALLFDLDGTLVDTVYAHVLGQKMGLFFLALGRVQGTHVVLAEDRAVVPAHVALTSENPYALDSAGISIRPVS